VFQRRLPPGAFVSQHELVKLTGVPVGPLRDALRSLEADGIVTIHPRAGIEFVNPAWNWRGRLYQFRGIIEASAVAVYAETGDEAEMEDIERRHRAAAESIERDGLSPKALGELEALETLLHDAIIGSLRNSIIERSYRRVRNYLRILRLDRKLTPPLALRSLARAHGDYRCLPPPRPGRSTVGAGDAFWPMRSSATWVCTRGWPRLAYNDGKVSGLRQPYRVRDSDSRVFRLVDIRR